MEEQPVPTEPQVPEPETWLDRIDRGHREYNELWLSLVKDDGLIGQLIFACSAQLGGQIGIILKEAPDLTLAQLRAMLAVSGWEGRTAEAYAKVMRIPVPTARRWLRAACSGRHRFVETEMSESGEAIYRPSEAGRRFIELLVDEFYRRSPFTTRSMAGYLVEFARTREFNPE